METGIESFSGKIGPFGRRQSDLDLRTRSLCRRHERLIFPLKPLVPVSIYIID